jgi:hypothetical protein
MKRRSSPSFVKIFGRAKFFNGLPLDIRRFVPRSTAVLIVALAGRGDRVFACLLVLLACAALYILFDYLRFMAWLRGW